MTPGLIAFATLLGRRFGQSIAGWLIAFPFNSAPVSLFLALDHGEHFAAAAARGSIASVLGGCAYAVVYARVERGWPLAFAAASAAYVAAGVALRPLDVDAVPLAIGMTAVVALATRLIPRRAHDPANAREVPAWDLPLRIVVATAFVLVITFAAPALGPYVSALAASFPVFATILGVFTERHAGHAAASEIMRGLVAGLVGFTMFFLVIALAIEPFGIAAAFILAVVAILVVQGVTLAVLRRPAGPRSSIAT